MSTKIDNLCQKTTCRKKMDTESNNSNIPVIQTIT